jgi:hypothetical protein
MPLMREPKIDAPGLRGGDEGHKQSDLGVLAPVAGARQSEQSSVVIVLYGTIAEIWV